jgi:HPt (histidine-containing phosphotransfer) domain-containing protein
MKAQRSPPTAQPAVNLPELLARVDNDRVFLSELIGIFKLEFPKLLRSLQQSVAQENLASVETISHALKGMLAALSVTRSAAIASQIEQLARAGETAGLAEELKRLESEVADLVPALEAGAAGAQP